MLTARDHIFGKWHKILPLLIFFHSLRYAFLVITGNRGKLACLQSTANIKVTCPKKAVISCKHFAERTHKKTLSIKMLKSIKPALRWEVTGSGQTWA